MDYSSVLEKWVFYCPKCNLIEDPEPMSERLKKAIANRKRNGDLKK